MRAVLIVNPTATTITPAIRDLVTHALRSRLELTVVHTTHHGHGEELGRQAARDGVDLVIVHGGDGTINGVVNGMLGSPSTFDAASARRLPALAAVPGGSANVLVRSLGIANDPTVATNQLIESLDQRAQRPAWRRIGLIDCGERWAMVNAGLGVDAEVVAAVEAHRGRGAKLTPLRYWREAIPVSLAFSRRPPNLTLELPGRDPIDGVNFAWVSNSSPWTYSNTRPMVTNPDCRFETGLGLFAVNDMRVLPTLGLLRQLLAAQPNPRAKQLIRDDDIAWVRVGTMTGPAACQADGDYLGMRDSMTFRAVPDALAVIAPLSPQSLEK